MNIVLSNPVFYVVNSLSLGDTLVTAPVIKWAIENFHKDGKYAVSIAVEEFKDIFHFIPKDKLFFSPKSPQIDSSWIIRVLNSPKLGNGMARPTSMRMGLAQYAGIRLVDRILPQQDLLYLPLPEISTDHYNIDFTKTVIVTVTHRADNRQWPQETVEEIAKYIDSKGLIPVYIGKISDDKIWSDLPLKATFDIPSIGIDLRNKTSILELGSIFRKAKAVVGIDSGPIHVAGTTDIPIVCGYTSVSPTGLVPIRAKGKTFAVFPTSDLGCRFCQTNWQLDRHDFATCYYGHYECCKQMTSDKFIKCLEQIL